MALIRIACLGGLIFQGCDSRSVGVIKNADFREPTSPRSVDLNAGLKEHQITNGEKTLFFSRERIHGGAGIYIRKATLEIDSNGNCNMNTLRATMYPEEVATATSFFQIDSLVWSNCLIKDMQFSIEYHARMKTLGTLLDPLIDTFKFEGKPPLRTVDKLSKWDGAVSDSIWDGAFPD